MVGLFMNFSRLTGHSGSMTPPAPSCYFSFHRTTGCARVPLQNSAQVL